MDAPKIMLNGKGVIAHYILASFVNINSSLTSRKTIQHTVHKPTSNTNATRRLYFSTVGLFQVQQSDPAHHTSTGSSLCGVGTARAEFLLATPDASACHWLGEGSVSPLVGVVHSVNDRRLKETAWNKETKDPTI